MTKTEFVALLMERTGMSRADATRAVDVVLDGISDILAAGGEVNFTGFGKFSVAERGPRQGVNPRTGDRVTIAGGRVPKFSAGQALKRRARLPGDDDEQF